LVHFVCYFHIFVNNTSSLHIYFNHNFITTRFGRWHHFQDDNIKRIQNWCILFVISIFLSITLQASTFILILILSQHVSASTDTIFRVIILKNTKLVHFVCYFHIFVNNTSSFHIYFNHNFITTRFGLYWHHFQGDNIKKHKIGAFCLLFPFFCQYHFKLPHLF